MAASSIMMVNIERNVMSGKMVFRLAPLKSTDFNACTAYASGFIFAKVFSH